jgi:hypothetical protein
VAYPTIQQYQDALQHESTTFVDKVLAGGKIRRSGLGTPIVVSGGFALTYAVETRFGKFAVRCFHRDTASSLEQRYAAISQKIRSLASPYFVDPDYQAQGVKIASSIHPIVKMKWATGETLGEFVENNYCKQSELTNLLTSLDQLAAHLQQNGIAHGDVQEGNLMVANAGRQVQLIDYDGMYVPSIAHLGSTELGHRDYQHPGRTTHQFNDRLDRFSFIALNLALRALCESSALWDSSQSGAGVILFRGNDFSDPGSSKVIENIRAIPSLRREAENFAAICAASFDKVPTLRDFIAGRNIPGEAITGAGKRAAAAVYISPYPVLDATNFHAFNAHMGLMVELVGKVFAVECKQTKKERKPYVFIDFADWRGSGVKIVIWSDALKTQGRQPGNDWIGTWVSIRGMVKPSTPYEHNGKVHPRHEIAAGSLSQIAHIDEEQAFYRLGLPRHSPPTTRTTAPAVHAPARPPAPVPAATARPMQATASIPSVTPVVPRSAMNEALVQQMHQQKMAAQAQAARDAQAAQAQRASQTSPPPRPTPLALPLTRAHGQPPLQVPRPSPPPPSSKQVPSPSSASQWPGAAPPKKGFLQRLLSLISR